MKVLLVGNYLPDRQESMQIYASMMEAGLRARGHDVRLVRPQPILGTRVADTSALFKWLGYADKFVLFRRELRRAAHDAEVVHLCDHSNAMYVPMLANVPHVVTCHDVLAIRSAMGHFPGNPVGLTGCIFQRLIARGLRKAQAILCVSRKTRDDLRQFVGIREGRLHVVPNALSWPYQPISRVSGESLLASVGLKPGESYFLHVGSDHWYKNREAVIAIFADLRKLPAYARARLVMAGGSMNGKSPTIGEKFGVSDAILQAGRVSNEILQALYSGAIAMLFPSQEEGFGWPIVEAQACGCPVVTTDRPPMNEISGDAAVLIDPARPERAAHKIAQALNDTVQMRSDGLRNASSYSIQSMLDGCEALYREVMTRKL